MYAFGNDDNYGRPLSSNLFDKILVVSYFYRLLDPIFHGFAANPACFLRHNRCVVTDLRCSSLSTVHAVLYQYTTAISYSNVVFTACAIHK